MLVFLIISSHKLCKLSKSIYAGDYALHKFLWSSEREYFYGDLHHLFKYNNIHGL